MSTSRILDDHLKKFIGRTIALRRVKRYGHYPVMYYRSNDYIYSQRVAALVRSLNPIAQQVFGSGYDPLKAEALALVHDDAEIIFGDYPAAYKQQMNAHQLAAVHDEEQAAIRQLTERFPRWLGPYVYEALLKDAEACASLEAQVVCYADKYDALGEALHEIHAGNQAFAVPRHNEHGIFPPPTEYYARFFAAFPQTYPAMAPLLRVLHALLHPVKQYDYLPVATTAQPPTLSDLMTVHGRSGLHYKAWLKVVISDTPAEVIRALTAQTEYPTIP